MTKIVINECYGGFSLSAPAFVEWARRKDYEIVEIVDRPFRERYAHPLRPFSEEFVAYDPTRHTFEDLLSDRYLDRDDRDLVAVVEVMGEKSSGDHACLKVVEIPDGVEWEIHEYDGSEWIAEKHRTWS